MMPKTLIAVPCFDMVHSDFMESLVNLQKPPETSWTMVKNTMIYDARNIVTNNAIEAGFDRVFWMDSDMTFPKDALIKLSQAMDEGREFVSGLYFTRRMPEIKPVLFSRVTYEPGKGSESDHFFDYPEGIVECEGVGFGCALTSVDLLKRVGEQYGAPFTPTSCMGEDISFCWRVKQMGGKIYCDTRIKCGHVGCVEITENTYRSLHPNAP